MTWIIIYHAPNVKDGSGETEQRQRGFRRIGESEAHIKISPPGIYPGEAGGGPKPPAGEKPTKKGAPAQRKNRAQN